MKTPTARLVATSLIVVITGVAQAAGPLVHLEVHEPPADHRKVLDMRFDEIARDDASSTVEVTFVSGASVPASMFVLRGMCAIARARDRASFTSERVDGQAGRYRVTFPTPADGPTGDLPAGGKRPAQRVSAVFTLQQCGLVGF